MIVANTSALAAIVLDEADAEAFLNRMAAEDIVIVGAPTAFELKLVMHRAKGEALVARADRLLANPKIRVVPFGSDHLTSAFYALARFGGRPAKLNYGDCMAYAVAKLLDAPLLFKGNDFTHTDIEPVL